MDAAAFLAAGAATGTEPAAGSLAYGQVAYVPQQEGNSKIVDKIVRGRLFNFLICCIFWASDHVITFSSTIFWSGQPLGFASSWATLSAVAAGAVGAKGAPAGGPPPAGDSAPRRGRR
ncbi:unnamed protein product [Prorocentrum cordatum]|uniref:Solute carrier family 40 protein n=1 Tax=Prorocentrum cordatum TaxID=2364126 RepID=A0ABN9UWP5_9DINO|nr:unnamed protein product [Polarella glacialis]